MCEVHLRAEIVIPARRHDLLTVTQPWSADLRGQATERVLRRPHCQEARPRGEAAVADCLVSRG